MKTVAAVLVGANKPLELLELETPKLKRGQVLVKMEYTSLCGSQMNEIRGHKAEGYIPHTLGHEGYGTVVESKSSRFKEGETVVASWISDCNFFDEKEEISYYDNILGRVNSGQCATLLTYAIINEYNLYSFEATDPELAPFLGCVIPTAFSAAEETLGEEMDIAAVIGLGGVGMALSIILNIRKETEYVYGADLDEEKLKLSGLPSIYNILNSEEEYVSHIYDATGAASSFNTFWGKQDKKYILVGNYEAVKFEIDPMDLIVDQKDLVGVRGDSYPLGSLLKNGVEIETSCRYESFYLKDFEKVKGKIYNLKDVNEAINNFGREMKPVLRMS